MARRSTNTEQLTEANYEKVLTLLSAESPITKKRACEILGIAYNTTRLESLLERYVESKARDAARRAEKRYKPPTKSEMEYIVRAYLVDGDNVTAIAKSIYRSSGFVERILERVGCPRRLTSARYDSPEMLPDESVRESFNVGELVWSARYNTIGRIKSTVENQPNVYRVWLEGENYNFFCYQPADELGSLEHLKEYGI